MTYLYTCLYDRFEALRDEHLSVGCTCPKAQGKAQCNVILDPLRHWVRQEWYWDLTLPISLAHRMLCDFISWSMFQTRLIVLLIVLTF